MKIGIDIHSIGSGKGGNETYYRYLLSALSAADHNHEYVLFGTRKSREVLARSRNVALPFREISSNPYARIAYSLPRQIRQADLDIFLAQFIVPPFVKCRTVAAILDLTFEHFPEYFPAYQRAWSKVLIRASAHRADHIITLSEHSRRDIVETYGIPEEKITVTYLGAGDKFFPRVKSEAQDYVRRKYGIQRSFVLYLGRLQARKNLLRLVNAYAGVRKAGFPHALVLAGKPDYLFQPVLARIAELGLEQDVLVTGYTPSEDVPWFYAAADVFVFPSIYEGFGLPVIEAMACGVPVVTSRGTALEEVAGDAALLIDPLDELSMTNAIVRVLPDGELRSRLSHAGLQRSSQFNHTQTARQTLAAFEQAADRRPNKAAAPVEQPLKRGSAPGRLAS